MKNFRSSHSQKLVFWGFWGWRSYLQPPSLKNIRYSWFFVLMCLSPDEDLVMRKACLGFEQAFFVIQFAINHVMAIEEDTLQLGTLYDERRY